MIRLECRVINFVKSNVCFSKYVSPDLRARFCQSLVIMKVVDLGKYLGMPRLVGKNKFLIFSALKDRVWQSIDSWGSKMLNMASKEVMIKAMTGAISTYMMSRFKMPKGTINYLNGMFAKYWWGMEGNN